MFSSIYLLIDLLSGARLDKRPGRAPFFTLGLSATHYQDTTASTGRPTGLGLGFGLGSEFLQDGSSHRSLGLKIRLIKEEKAFLGLGPNLEQFLKKAK